jgi:hypothetical protein
MLEVVFLKSRFESMGDGFNSAFSSDDRSWNNCL